jgi:hypothetical protein
MDKKPPHSPAFSLGRLTRLVALAICACILATHFVTEFPEAPLSAGEFEGSGHVHIDLDGCEDNLILPLLDSLPVEHPLLPPASLRVAQPAFLPIRPLLPPPNS